MPFEFEKTKIQDVILIKPKVFGDNRGFFMEEYKKSDFLKNGIDIEFVQDNFSKSNKYVLRGLHFQKEPYSQAKLVRCLKGKIIDVALDLRFGTPSFLKYFKIELSDKNNFALFIPKGFAHGFIALEESMVLYKTDCEYNKDFECGIKWDDPENGIDWGVDFKPVVSQKDENQKSLKDVLWELKQ